MTSTHSLFTPHASTGQNPTSTGTITTYGNSIDTNAGGTSSSTGSALGENSFLNLLSVQLQNQDPTQPISDEAWVSELAQFSSLQQTSTLNTTLTNSTSFTELTQAATLVGKNVTTSALDSSGNPINGTVTSVTLGSGGVVMNIGTNTALVNQLTGFTS